MVVFHWCGWYHPYNVVAYDCSTNSEGSKNKSCNYFKVELKAMKDFIKRIDNSAELS
jgi:hypothetical protein